MHAVPMELRKIMFSMAELQAAVCAYCRRKGMAVISANIGQLTLGEDPRETVVLHFRVPPGGDAPSKKTLRREEVVEALIHYCIRHRVPLPRAGKKILWPQDDGVSLMITLVGSGDAAGRMDKDAFAGAAVLHNLIQRDH
jgi:hypothetical protein